MFNYDYLFSLLGPYWTHILFTWTKVDGLKVYTNGTLTAEDKTGSVSENYGDPNPGLVIGTDNNRANGHYVTGAFDEFVIWERALSPNEIMLYYSAAIGRTSWSTSKYFLSFSKMACLL